MDVTIGDESPDDNAANHRKERPIWMTESTVINSDGSQVYYSVTYIFCICIIFYYTYIYICICMYILCFNLCNCFIA